MVDVLLPQHLNGPLGGPRQLLVDENIGVVIGNILVGDVDIASTASEYPLANFQFRGPLAPKSKIACWGAGLQWRPQSVKRFEAPTEPTGEIVPDPY